jgi:hypothetical protein
MAAPSVHHLSGTPGRDPESNLERIRGRLEEAREAGAGLLVTPELFITAEASVDDSLLRERLRWIARSTGVGLIASTPEATGSATYIGADWWDASGNHVAHVRKHRLATWQLARGFTAWNGRPQTILTSMYSEIDMPWPVAVAFSDDAADPAYAYFLRDHGVRTVLELGTASSRFEAIAPSPAWAPKHTGVPFPQTGPLPEELLRPLPRIADAWWTQAVVHATTGWGS